MSSSAFKRIMDSITPEQKAKFDAQMKAFDEYHRTHPDHNERYGTDRSYWLEQIRAKGFDPIGITVMACEETLIFATEEESKKGWETFKSEGWWHYADEWKETREWYVKNMYDGVEADAPEVFCLNDKYKDLFE